MYTMMNVAQKAKVSRTTVSRYLNKNGYVSKESQQKIENAIVKLNYLPNKIAQSLVKRETKNIAFIVSDISNPVSSAIAKNAEKIANHYGFNIILCNTGFNLQQEAEYIYKLIEKQVDGIILAPNGKGGRHLDEVIRRKIPLVFITRKVEGIDADYVRFANESDSFKVVEHLIRLGHKRIGVICRLVDKENTKSRLAGYINALKQYQIPLEEELIVSGQAIEKVGYKGMERLFKLHNPPTAIYTAVNFFAAGVIRFCKDKGIKIPEEIALASFESFEELDPIISPSITANKMPTKYFGKMVVQILIERIINKEKDFSPFKEISLKGKLIQRESSLGKKLPRKR